MFKKNDFANILKEINSNYDSMTNFAKKASFDRSYISKYINMKLDNPPTPKILEKISDASNGLASYYDLLAICGYIDKESYPNFSSISTNNISNQYYMCPVYNYSNLSQSNFEDDYIEGRIPIAPDLMHIAKPEEYFFLRINSESMNKIIKKGAYALIHKQHTVKNGDIALVLINNTKASLNKFSKQGDLIVLEPMSYDNNFQVQIYNNTTPIKILGTYVGKFELNI